MPVENLPYIRMRVIGACIRRRRPVIVAMHPLESMVSSTADATMPSGEWMAVVTNALAGGKTIDSIQMWPVEQRSASISRAAG